MSATNPWIDIPPPDGSTDGVTIHAFTSGPLAGYAVITIPENGCLGWDEHDQDEHGFVLRGRVTIFDDLRHGASVCCGRYVVPARNQHRIVASLGCDVQLLARLEAAVSANVSGSESVDARDVTVTSWHTEDVCGDVDGERLDKVIAELTDRRSTMRTASVGAPRSVGPGTHEE